MKKPKIILFYPRTYHERNYRYYYIPYSLLAISSMLNLNEFDVTIIDNNVNKRENYLSFLFETRNETLCVGISSMIGAQIRDGLKFAKQVREISSEIPIIWGGALPTLLPEMTSNHELVDIAVRGQGEITFYEIVHRLKRNKRRDDVLGISYKNNAKVRNNPDRPLEDLNKFPPYRKSYPLINVRDYIFPDEHIGPRTVSYHSSQGCPYSCGFCAEVGLWKCWWSGLSPERMLDDIQYLVEQYNVDGIKFYDSEFFVNLSRAITFAKELLERNIKIKWGASIHPRTLYYKIKENQLNILAKSGLRRLLIGIESGVQEELNLIKKNITPEIVFEIAERIDSHGIIGCFDFIIGYPSMPEENVGKTFSFIKKLMDAFPRHEVKLHLYGPYPGTPLYSLALKYGFIAPKSLEEWSNFDYYGITTPWAKPEWEKKIREFNESYYPYVHQYPYSNQEA